MAFNARVLAAATMTAREVISLSCADTVRLYRLALGVPARTMALHTRNARGAIRYRQIEHYRMPSLAYLALDAPTELTRGDFARLALSDGAGESNTLPYRSGISPTLSSVLLRPSMGRH